MSWDRAKTLLDAHESVLLEMGVHGGRSGLQPRSVPILRRRQPQVRPAEDADIVRHVHGSGRLGAERRVLGPGQLPVQGSQAVRWRHLRHATGNRAAEAHGGTAFRSFGPAPAPGSL